MRLIWNPALIIVLISFFAAQSAAQCDATDLPAIEVPKEIRPYADVEKFLEALRSVIDLMGTAKFSTSKEKYLKGSCDKPEHHSVFRGYQLVKTAYFLFSSKMERGWFDPDPSAISVDNVGLFQPNRLLLVSVWTPSVLKRAVNLTERLATLPQEVKSDLIAFLNQLRAFRNYHSFLGRKPDELKYLKERIAETCRTEELDYLRALKKSGRAAASSEEFEFDSCRSRRLGTIEKETREYRELINSVRDHWIPPISECLDGSGNYYPELQLGKDAAIKKRSVLHPTHYMLFFWDRRETEGTSALAYFVLGRAISALKQ